MTTTVQGLRHPMGWAYEDERDLFATHNWVILFLLGEVFAEGRRVVNLEAALLDLGATVADLRARVERLEGGQR